MYWGLVFFLHIKFSKNFGRDGHSRTLSNRLLFAHWQFFNKITFTFRPVAWIIVITPCASLSSTWTFSKFCFQWSNLFSKVVKFLPLAFVDAGSISEIFLDVIQHKWNLKKKHKVRNREICENTYWVLLSWFWSEKREGHWFNNRVNFVVNVLFIEFFLDFSFLCSFFIISHT